MVEGYAAAEYLGTLMRNPSGIDAARIGRDAVHARQQRKALGRLTLAATARTTFMPLPRSRAPRCQRSRPAVRTPVHARVRERAKPRRGAAR